MTEDQFWKGPPYLAVVYRQVAMNRRREMSEKMWLQGMYVYEAFATVLHNAFRKKGSKPLHYPTEPYRITPLTKEEKQQKAEAERKKAIASLTAWKAAWDKKNG